MNRQLDRQPLIFSDQQMADAQQFEFVGGHAVVYSARCPGKTTANEDAMAIVPIGENSGVLLVADGMGGHAAGEVAATTAIKEMVAAILEAVETGALIRSAIVNGFERANRQVRALGTGGGTTLSVVELDGAHARPYHAGDSIILIVGSRGKIKLQTTSHSPVGFGVEAGLLDAQEAMHHEDRHVVLNAVGSESMRIEIGSAVKLAKRDTVLLASDGLSDNLTDEEIIERIRRGPRMDSVNQLLRLCNERMVGDAGHSKPDDVSILLFRRFDS